MKFRDWWMEGGAPILSLEEMASERERVKSILETETFALTSGGFDPAHPGHLSCIEESAYQAERLIVVVNDDGFLKRKRFKPASDFSQYEDEWPDDAEEYLHADQVGKPFMPHKVRCQIVSMLRNVDYVVAFKPSDNTDQTVCEALKIIKPDIFAKGGDRDSSNTPEYKLCQDLDIAFVQNMGNEKHWSSSDFLEKWGQHYVYNIYGVRYDGCLE